MVLFAALVALWQVVQPLRHEENRLQVERWGRFATCCSRLIPRTTPDSNGEVGTVAAVSGSPISLREIDPCLNIQDLPDDTQFFRQ